MNFPLFFITSLAIIHLSGALQCNVMNTIHAVFVQQCPAHIVSCMKFVCRLRGYEEIYKGCDDPVNPAVSCQTLQENCEAQGGIGQCYSCTHEMCNSSSSLSLIAVAVVALLSYSL